MRAMTLGAGRVAPTASVTNAHRLPAGLARLSLAVLVVPLILYAAALVIRLVAAAQISYPLSEGSAYYTSVARNIVEGRGLVIDALWSYATPPLAFPRPAFELWQPMASFVAAGAMAFAGPTFGAAQMGAAVVGSLLAPLAWLVARDATTRLGLPAHRATAIALGSGAAAALLGPFLIASAAVPDSYVPFTVAAVAATLVMPGAIAGDRRAAITLGLVLGVAYLSRLEALYLGVAFLVTAALSHRNVWRTTRLAAIVALAGALVALPWWLRNWLTFGTPLPGQVADNLFLTSNEQIFAYLDQPTLDGFLGQGLGQILANIAGAMAHNSVDVLIVPGAPVVVPGLLAVAVGAALARRRRLPPTVASSPLALLLLYGALTLAASSVLFPVATLWGTFEHASGPLLVGLTVAALLGGDALVAWLGRRRGWQRNNAWLAPLAVLALTVALASVQVTIASRQSENNTQLMDNVAQTLPARLDAAGVDASAPIVTDRPIWLSDALRRPTLALPDEPVETLSRLAIDFGARSVVVFGQRGPYPLALGERPASACFAPLTPLTAATGPSVFVIREDCLS